MVQLPHKGAGLFNKPPFLGTDGTRANFVGNTATRLGPTPSNTSCGRLIYVVYGFNTGATVQFAKLYDLTSTPNPASDSPFLILPVPGGSGAMSQILMSDDGLWFIDNRLWVRATTSVGDTDTASAGSVCIQLGIK